MAPAFGRSISFPLSPARASRPRAAASAARHVRSVSLPTARAHPLLAHLHNTTGAVRAWLAAGAEPASPAAGLAHVDALLAALAELLLLPEARAALPLAGDRLLDAFLALADAHGAFQEALLELRRHAADAQAALRRRDQPRLASAARAQRHAEKDLARLASSVRAAAKLPHLPLAAAAADAAEVSAALAEAVAAVASASAAVFSAVEALSSAATAAAASSSKKPALISLVKKSKAAASSDEEKEMAALDKLEDLDECIADMEAGSDKVFRSILHTRVQLLNIQTQTC
ncbi:hypothetical protein ACP4OV_014026 [Aristida adscensionis]